MLYVTPNAKWRSSRGLGCYRTVAKEPGDDDSKDAKDDPAAHYGKADFDDLAETPN